MYLNIYKSKASFELGWQPMGKALEEGIETKNDVIVYCPLPLENFASVSVDGETVDEANYTLASGSTVLTFEAEYLATLSEGDHTVVMNYDMNGVPVAVTSTLAVQEKGVTAPEGMPSGDTTTSTNATTSTSGAVAGATAQSSKNVSGSPKTGDEYALAAWGTLAAVSAMGIGAAVLFKKRI
jgi:hypothetical protein